ncbi:hypothetical protein AB0M00_19545 [Streptomyces chartreusis]|uniref:hypothetical protein n=1 Tax=Streptomyces chartreusis TaxID=1969 RepID=UPI0034441368
MTSTELVHAPRRASTARRYVAVVIVGVSDVIRVGALLTGVVLAAASVDPGHAWNLDAPWQAIVVILLALLGVERLGLALRNLGAVIEQPAPHYTPRTPKHPAH